MSTLSTHVLDTSMGTPAAGMPILLHQFPLDVSPIDALDAPWREIGSATTNADGRAPDIAGTELPPGTYRLTFATNSYFTQGGRQSFYPFAAIVFTIADDAAHYHVPLLISPYGYSTYRGS